MIFLFASSVVLCSYAILEEPSNRVARASAFNAAFSESPAGLSTRERWTPRPRTNCRNPIAILITTIYTCTPNTYIQMCTYKWSSGCITAHNTMDSPSVYMQQHFATLYGRRKICARFGGGGDGGCCFDTFISRRRNTFSGGICVRECAGVRQ